MTKDEALDLALEALEYIENNYMSLPKSGSDAITAIKQARALDKKAENARELGLDYEPEQKRPQNCGTGFCSCIECVMEPAPVQEPVAIDGNTSDGYHTFNELYEFRKAYNAALFNEWAVGGKCSVHKSWRHHDGELCFGGGWFIVVAVLPDGQISNHYEAKDWDLFAVPETERALFEFDGHTGADVVERLKAYTTPPAAQRPWVGLTPREIYNLWEDSGVPFVDWDSFASITRAIESKLREKNVWSRQHVTDGNPCWCEPETSYTDPETGASVIVHKEPQ
jgi:hypothetical protein